MYSLVALRRDFINHSKSIVAMLHWSQYREIHTHTHTHFHSEYFVQRAHQQRTSLHALFTSQAVPKTDVISIRKKEHILVILIVLWKFCLTIFGHRLLFRPTSQTSATRKNYISVLKKTRTEGGVCVCVHACMCTHTHTWCLWILKYLCVLN